jgi:cytochrome c peroxidase
MTSPFVWKAGIALIVAAGLAVPLTGAAAPKQARKAPTASGEQFMLPELLGLEDANTFVPQENPLTAKKIELGRLLFFDKRMSKNNTIACASCHIPAMAFTDGQPVSTGINRSQGGRSAPVPINRVFSKAQFWDGRAATLEDQSVGPFVNPVVQKLKGIEGYRSLFKDALGSDITTEAVGKAIASFQRTILSGNSPADQFDVGGDQEALTEDAQRGLTLFRGKARCTRCHSGFNFSDEKFHNIGIGWDTNTVDLGRFMVTKNPEDIGAFKTPTLREISRTAPYMHDGRFASLDDVVNFYNQGGIKNPHLDNTIIPLELTAEEKRDLVAFLRSLNGEGWQQITAPTEFPQ